VHIVLNRLEGRSSWNAQGIAELSVYCIRIYSIALFLEVPRFHVIQCVHTLHLKSGFEAAVPALPTRTHLRTCAGLLSPSHNEIFRCWPRTSLHAHTVYSTAVRGTAIRAHAGALGERARVGRAVQSPACALQPEREGRGPPVVLYATRVLCAALDVRAE
jgi:hypothetical protein